MIRAICLWHATGGAVECDDLMQDVLLQLWHSRDKLRKGCTAEEERAWVRLMCRSVVSHFHRKKRLTTVSLDESIPVAAPDQKDHRETIEMLSEGLNDHERHTLRMILDGYEADDIARELGIKKQSVTQLKWRIVQKMKQRGT